LEIQVQVLSTTQTAKQNAKGGTYQELEVAYKDLTNGGKVASRKVMDFAAKEVFQLMSFAKPGEVFDIEMVKKGDFWNWVKATKGTATAPSASPTGAKPIAGGQSGTASKGGWETPEERAKRQVYIIRQSSLGHAVTALKTEKTIPKAEEIIELAKRFEEYVFSDGQSVSQGARYSGLIEDISEDIPF
jgi:hypothetical protein